jgi:multidrug efflux pump subunit AcrA (membrane-fusion protein)
MRSVSPAERVGTLWVIDQGLKPGEKVVVGGLQMAKSGMKVVTTSAPAGGQAPPAPAPAPPGKE